jgi:hypothetical protein
MTKIELKQSNYRKVYQSETDKHTEHQMQVGTTERSYCDVCHVFAIAEWGCCWSKSHILTWNSGKNWKLTRDFQSKRCWSQILRYFALLLTLTRVPRTSRDPAMSKEDFPKNSPIKSPWFNEFSSTSLQKTWKMQNGEILQFLIPGFIRLYGCPPRMSVNSNLKFFNPLQNKIAIPGKWKSFLVLV